MPKAYRVNLAFILLAITAFSTTCFAQSPATFKTYTSTERGSSSPQAIDVNNDGSLDLAQAIQSNVSPGRFSVRIANGNGTFRNPVVYSFTGSPYDFTSGDFNRDGNVDLVFTNQVNNQLVLFLGKGDGTFQAPKYITVALPAGQSFDTDPPLAADFNGDGKLDLVEATFGGGSTESLYLIPGDGTGNFGSPVLINMLAAHQMIWSTAVGDFDGDGRADVAIGEYHDCYTEFDCLLTLHVLYNDGNSRFTEIAPYTAPDEFQLNVGDLNSDGTTDVFGSPNGTNNELIVLYGQTDRTFHAYTMPAPATPSLAMADFNGDGRMDLVGFATYPEAPYRLVFFLAGSSEGTFTQQTYGIPSYGTLGPIVGDFNSDTKPDVLGLIQDTTNVSDSTLFEALNTTATGNWGGCSYPHAGEGITVCAPDPSSTSPVTFNASSDSFGQLRLMELWVDGKKVADQYHAWGSHAWFNLTGTTLSSGSHRGVLFAKDIDNRQQETVFNFTVGGGGACSTPASPGVTICMPASGSTVSSPVQVSAAATVTGTLSSVQLWIDGVKKYSTASSTLNTSISVAAGTHRFAIIAVNTAGQKWESAVNATVK
jgi:hypothetical protein